MAKVYTAQEMRDMAFFFDRNHDQFIKARSNSVLARIPETIAILCQAADALEREEKRGKREKREYAVKWLDENSVANNMGERRDIAESVVRAVGESKAQLVRREVGEWEEVK